MACAVIEQEGVNNATEIGQIALSPCVGFSDFCSLILHTVAYNSPEGWWWYWFDIVFWMVNWMCVCVHTQVNWVFEANAASTRPQINADGLH